MISYQQAKDRLIEQMPDYGAERCCWKNAVGRLLREPVWVDRPMPPYDRVMMDGYAMRASDLAVDSLFRVKGVAWAGKAASALSDEPFSCMEVMTGAALPIGADVVIPVEKTERWGDGIIRISDKAMREVGTFIHRAGSDARAGDIALEVGRKIGSREMGVIASCGATSLSVARLPKIAIQATGDELVAVEQMPMDHQIRQSNGHALLAGLTAVGFAAEVLPTLADDASADEIQQKWQGYDLVIVTGAVSMGKKILCRERCRISAMTACFTEWPNVLEAFGSLEKIRSNDHRAARQSGFGISGIACDGSACSSKSDRHE